MRELHVPKITASVRVEGDTLTLVTPEGLPLGEHTATYHQKSPWWEGLEGFCDYCGDGLRVAAAVLDNGDRLIYLYDHREAFYPLISQITDDDARHQEAMARDGEPELYGTNGECLEWQQGANFCYAWNLDTPYFSEWGYAPFPQPGEDEQGMYERQTANINAMLEAFGGADFVVQIEGPQIAGVAYQHD